VNLRQVRILVLIAFGSLVIPTNAWAIYGDSDEAFGLDASIRNNLFATYNHDLDFTTLDDENRANGIGNLLFRLTAGGQPAQWLKYEVHGLSSTTINGGGTSLGGLFGTRSDNSLGLRYRLFDGEHALRAEPDVNSTLSFERGNVSIFLPFADITIGRQAISFGKAYFWNPLDVFSPFNATQFDRDYKNGVDAFKIDIPITDNGGFTLVASGSHKDAAPNKPRWYSSAVIGRLDWTIANWDLSLQAGKKFGGYQVGAAGAGELFEIPLRLESAYFEPDKDDDFERYASLVVGTGYRFENSLSIEVEYFYNSGASAVPIATARERLSQDGRSSIRASLQDPESFCLDSAELLPENVDCITFANALADDDAQIAALVDEQIGSLSDDQARTLSGLAHGLAEGRILHISEQLLGLSLSYEIFAVLRGSLATIFSISDHSAIIQPGLSLSVSDEVDVQVGGILSFGKRVGGTPQFCAQSQGCPESEFGSYPHVFYVQSKLYF
jgi:hypothetical protein